MAIVKATYTKSRHGAKASLRYITHRPGKDGKRATRTLFGNDGAMGKWQAYRMIDEAKKRTVFFRMVISPDPQQEDTQKDLHLWDITEQTMLRLEERLQHEVSYVAAEHADHAPHRHVHVLVLVTGRLTPQDFQALRETATAAAVLQRKGRDLAVAQQAREREEEQWER